MQDRSFEEAMQELNARTVKEIQDHMGSRTRAVLENTVSSTVTDIENVRMRAVVTDMLCLNKIIALLSSLTNMDLLADAELEELKDYLSQLHSRAYPPKQREGEDVL